MSEAYFPEQPEPSGKASLRERLRHAPRAVVVHLPWFLEGVKVEADGKPVALADGAVRLPPSVTRVSFTWTGRSAASMSFDRTVESYEREYARRYQRLMETGTMPPLIDSWRVPE